MEKIKNMSVGKKIYASLWAITGVFLIVLLVLFVTWKDKTQSRIPNTAGYVVTAHKGVPGKTMPDETEVFVKIVDVDKNDKTTDATKNVYAIGDDGSDEATAIKLEEGKFLSIDQVKIIRDYKNYFDFNKYYVSVWTEDETTAEAQTDREPIFTIDSPLQEELTAEAKSTQNSVAGVGLGFLIAILGAIMATVFVSINEKKGGKK